MSCKEKLSPFIECTSVAHHLDEGSKVGIDRKSILPESSGQERVEIPNRRVYLDKEVQTDATLDSQINVHSQEKDVMEAWKTAKQDPDFIALVTMFERSIDKEM